MFAISRTTSSCSSSPLILSPFRIPRSFPLLPPRHSSSSYAHVFASLLSSTFHRHPPLRSSAGAARNVIIVAPPPSGLRSSVGRLVGRGAERSRGLVRAMAAAAPPHGYRANVGICLVNKNNQVFVASRLDVPGAWQMPQGGVNDGEDPREAATRELKEETGVTSSEIIAEVPGWLTYDFPPDVKTKLAQLWGKEWNGQAQKWFLFRFLGNENEINLEGDGEEPAEFAEYTWLPVEEVINRAVDFKRPVYERVFETFSPILKS